MLIKSRIEVKSKKSRRDIAQVTKFWAAFYERDFFFAWHFLRLSYFMFYSVMKGKNVCAIANSIFANAVVLVTSFPRHFFFFLSVAIIHCAINVSKNKNWHIEGRLGSGQKVCDFVRIKYLQRTMYHTSKRKRSKYFFWK